MSFDMLQQLLHVFSVGDDDLYIHFRMRCHVARKHIDQIVFEYSCAVKPHIRASGNRQSGIRETAIASLLAQCFI